MSGYSIGLNAMRTAMQLTDIAADNIANANTPGYHAKKASVVPVMGPSGGGIATGMGCEVSDVQRMCNELVERALVDHTQVQASLSQQESTFASIDSLFSEPSDSGLDKQLGGFFDSINALSASPNDMALREEVVQKATTVCNTLNEDYSSLDLMQQQAFEGVNDAVSQVNDLTQRIAALNQQIQQAETAGSDASSLLDSRGQLVNQLSQFVDVAQYSQQNGVVNLSCGGMLLVSGGNATTLHVSTSGTKAFVACPNDDAHPMDITGGKLNALLSAANDVLPGYMSQLDDLANTLRRQVNLVHTTGIGMTDSFTQLSAESTFSSDTPVSEMGYGVPAGTNERLTINVVDKTTGEVTQYNLTVDTTQSAADFVASLAAAINSQVGHVTATVLQGKLNLSSDSGYAFNFASKYDPNPAMTAADTSAPPTTSPTILDAFTGTQDLTYNVSFNSGGVIGTDNVQMLVNVTDANGNVVDSFTRNIDNTYNPGDAISLDNGLKFSLSAGSVGTGDSFQVTAHTTTDTAGVLDALGMNALFVGVGAGAIHVSDRISENPTLLAGAQSDQPGDNHNLLALLGMSDDKTMSGGSMTIADYFRSILSDVGTKKNAASTRLDAETQQVAALQNQADSAGAVDLNEEMLNIMQSRQVYEGALKYIQTLDQMLTDLANTL